MAAQEGQPAYRVTYAAFAPEEWRRADFRLVRLEALYGVGLCVLGRGTYAEMALEGRRLGETLE